MYTPNPSNVIVIFLRRYWQLLQSVFLAVVVILSSALFSPACANEFINDDIMVTEVADEDGKTLASDVKNSEESMADESRNSVAGEIIANKVGESDTGVTTVLSTSTAANEFEDNDNMATNVAGEDSKTIANEVVSGSISIPTTNEANNENAIVVVVFYDPLRKFDGQDDSLEGYKNASLLALGGKFSNMCPLNPNENEIEKEASYGWCLPDDNKDVFTKYLDITKDYMEQSPPYLTRELTRKTLSRATASAFFSGVDDTAHGDVKASYPLVESATFIMRGLSEIPRSSRSLMIQAKSAGNYSEVGKIIREGAKLQLQLAVPQATMAVGVGPALKFMGQPDIAANVAGVYFNRFAIGIPARNWNRNAEDIIGLEHPYLQTMPILLQLGLTYLIYYPLSVVNTHAAAIDHIGYYAIADTAAAYATSGTILLFLKIDSNFEKYEIFSSNSNEDNHISQQLWEYGVPVAVGSILASASGTIMTFCYGKAGGNDALTAKKATDMVSVIVNPLFVAVASSSHKLINQALVKNPSQVGSVMQTGLGLTALIGTPISLVLALKPQAFTNSPSALPAIRAAGITFVVTALDRVSKEELSNFPESKTTRNIAEVVRVAIPAGGGVLFIVCPKTANISNVIIVQLFTSVIPAAIMTAGAWITSLWW